MVEHNIDNPTATCYVARETAAERMRRCRARRRAGFRCFVIELHNSEITALIQRGFLDVNQHDDPAAVVDALYRHLERSLGRPQ